MTTTNTDSWILPVSWISAWLVASVIYRRKKGKIIIPRKPRDALFFEGWASGRSDKTIFGKLGGGANGCLMVCVVANTLIVVPRFPFNLMFIPEIFGLEYYIPRGNIRSVMIRRGILRRSVKVEFISESDGVVSVNLFLKKPDSFLQAIGPVPE